MNCLLFLFPYTARRVGAGVRVREDVEKLKAGEGVPVVKWVQERGAEGRMGRPKKYTAKKLKEQVARYFDSISYMTQARDAGGQPLCNLLGEPLMVRCYATPPTLGGLARYLGIDKSTWAEYANPEKCPELAPICADAKGRVELYLQQELVTREKGSLRGLEFDLTVNHGWVPKAAVELGGVDKVDVKIQVTDEVKKGRD